MKNFILGLIMIFTLSVTFSSIGFATPIDAKIEKTFIFDEAVFFVAFTIYTYLRSSYFFFVF